MANHTTGKSWLGFNWQISLASGWGVLGLNLALEAEQDGRYQPVPLIPTADAQWLQPDQLKWLNPVLARERIARNLLDSNPEGQCRCDFPVIHSLGNCLGQAPATERVIGNQNLAIAFFEDTELGPDLAATAGRYSLILPGSTWNTQILRERGVTHVATFLQGVDLAAFQPAARPSDLGRPFIIYSGGKLEYRKGQDIVVAAFKRFHQRHPNSLLVTTWHNHWPQTIPGIERAGYVQGTPVTNPDRSLDVTTWLEANGVPRGASKNFGPVLNRVMPQLYHQADVALFTNRCEGGTNLVAMECLACGVPTILSANTGHLDLADPAHCFPLFRQGAVAPSPKFHGTQGWGESDVEEALENLERVYRDRAEANRRGEAAARFMKNWSWRVRFEELVRHMQALR